MIHFHLLKRRKKKIWIYQMCLKKVDIGNLSTIFHCLKMKILRMSVINGMFCFMALDDPEMMLPKMSKKSTKMSPNCFPKNSQLVNFSNFFLNFWDFISNFFPRNFFRFFFISINFFSLNFIICSDFDEFYQIFFLIFLIFPIFSLLWILRFSSNFHILCFWWFYLFSDFTLTFCDFLLIFFLQMFQMVEKSKNITKETWFSSKLFNDFKLYPITINIMSVFNVVKRWLKCYLHSPIQVQIIYLATNMSHFCSTWPD